MNDINLLGIRKEMKKNDKKAIKLYKKSLSDGYDLFDPYTWIYYQDKLRIYCEKYIINADRNSKLEKKRIINNSFSEYMLFMYNTYPSGLGNKLKEYMNNKENHDGAEIYYNLKYLNNN